MKLNKQQIEQLIPHCGKMCLIEQLDYWDQDNIHCSTMSHQAPENPLRLNGTLSAIHLLEYGAQTMAIHGGLLKKTAIPGFLAAVRNVQITVDRLDDINGRIYINAQALIYTDNGVIYEFSINDANNRILLNARATVINT